MDQNNPAFKPVRERLPDRRACETIAFEHRGADFTMTAGRYADGRIGEIFINAGHANSALDALASDAAIAISFALQHGADSSTSSPALSGTYAFDAATQSKMLAVSLYISVNGKFPAGQTAFPWADASGTMHSFNSTAQFQSLATALADYATALDLGQTPTAPVTIP